MEEGGLLKTYNDVPESIREKLYIQEQQRLKRQKGGTQSTNSYPLSISLIFFLRRRIARCFVGDIKY
ncbi:hypothetical protein N7493_010712 [Penicillium malachiteum]|uniref:Uncharacterized protein n=1 Tax=Penicillium malachiteum TaxID=1324776 RepID=A0AAD6HDI0_9EURO|nr:hypothetical protein N7493_010712 [Penicillium malachiteum]